MPSLTFTATANAVRYVGAWPVFIDSEPEFWQIDVDQLARFLQCECLEGPSGLRNRRSGRRVVAIIPVDLLGHPSPLQSISELAERYGLLVIEDASQALGARYLEQPVGQQADVACFSFNGNKIITGGCGGMLMTEQPEWAERARRLSTQSRSDPLGLDHDEVGFNYRMANLNAAVLCAQIDRLEEFVARKRKIAQAYGELLGEVDGVVLPREAPWASHAYWLYTIQVEPREFGMNSRELGEHLREAGIETRPLPKPLSSSLAHSKAQNYGSEVAERVWQRGLSLPSSVRLSDADLERVADAIRQAFQASASTR